MQNISSSISGAGSAHPSTPPNSPTATNAAANAPIHARLSILGRTTFRQATPLRASLLQTLQCRKVSHGPVASKHGASSPSPIQRSTDSPTVGKAGTSSPAAKLRTITASGKSTIKVYAPSTVELPAAVKADFSKFFLRRERKSIKLELLKYKLEEVFTLFNKSNLNWLTMKHNYGFGEGLSKMKVLNQLREFILKDILKKVKERFPELTIINLGTISEISDCDFSFEMPPGHEDKEARAVAFFNEIFEKQFQSTASIVFDSNAYTQYHLEDLFTPNFSINRNNTQIDMSLVMFFRNATNEKNLKNWEALKEALSSKSKIAAALGSDLKESAAKRLEGLQKNICQQLKKLIDGKILEIFARKGRQTPETQKVPNFQQNATEISRVDPNLKVQAMNALHAEFRAKSQDTYRLRCHVVDCLRSQDPDQFCRAFAQLVKSFQELHKAASHQDEKSPAAAATASQPVSKKEEPENQDLVDLKKRQPQVIPTNPNIIFYCLDIKRNYLEKSISKKIADNQRQLEGLQSDIKQLAFMDSEEQRKELLYKKAEISRLIAKQEHLKEELRSVAQKFAKLKMPDNQDIFESRVVALLKPIADSLLVQLEQANCWAGLFAQEAHVSRGAFAFTVKVIQTKSQDLLSPAEYLQAIIELAGFYLGHQMKEAPPYIKLIEGSKYIYRFSRAISDLKKIAKAASVPALEILETQEKLATYFEELYALRSNKIQPNTLRRAVENYLLSIDTKQRTTLRGQLLNCKFQKNLDTVISGLALKQLKKFYVPAENEGLSDKQKQALEYSIRTTILGGSANVQSELFLNSVNEQLLKILAQCYHWVIKQG